MPGLRHFPRGTAQARWDGAGEGEGCPSGLRPLQSGAVGREARGLLDLPLASARDRVPSPGLPPASVPGVPRFDFWKIHLPYFKSRVLVISRGAPDSLLVLGVLEGTPSAAVSSWLCPTDPARSVALAVFAYLFGFFPRTFQEPESRDSVGQRAFVKRQAGEGRRGGRERGDPSGLGCEDRVAAPRRECPPRAWGSIPPRGAVRRAREGPRRS